MTYRPTWTPDGNRIAYAELGGATNLYWQRADGSGDPQRLTESPNRQVATSWHPSGKILAFQETSPRTLTDIMILRIDGDETSGWKIGTPTAFRNGPARDEEAMFSPDGKWLAYQSAETGRMEVFIRPFPGPGGRWQISSDGGALPTWSRARAELFYLAPDRRIMVTPYRIAGEEFRADKPRALSDVQFAADLFSRRYDVHPDGERFVVTAPLAESTPRKQDKIVFVSNFFDELRRLTPANRR